VFQDGLASGGANMRILTLPVVAVEGGLLLLDGGKIVGSIGVSGGTAEQDSAVAVAGAAVAK
jgi:glc operon protein GlcG